MRVLFYDFDAGALGIQSLFAALKTSPHEVYLYLDRSCPRQYLAASALLERVFTLTDDQVCDDLLAYDAQVVCFSLTSLTYQPILAKICLLKKRAPHLIVVCGGVHATLLPEYVVKQPEIDFVVIGEAERSFPMLLETLAALGAEEAKTLPRERLPGVWNMRAGQMMDRGLSPIPEDLDALPFLEKELHLALNPGLSRIYSTVCVRGCFYACTFCNDPAIREVYDFHHRPYCRTRTVDSVLAELRLAKDRYHPRHVEFHDDIFAARHDWLSEFSRRYPDEIGLPFNIQTHPLLLDDEKLEMLARSGCVTIELGLQSADPEVRKTILRRPESNEHVKQLVRKALSLGIRLELDFIVNLPGETPEHIQEMLDFVYETRPTLVILHYLVCLPKTEIAALAMKMGLLSAEELQALHERGAVTSPWYPSRDLRTKYHVLPIQLAVACAFPPRLARRINHRLEHTLLGSICAPLASFLVVATRVYAAFFDRRAYLYRGQFSLGIRNIGCVVARKVFGTRPPRLRLGTAAAQKPVATGK